MHTLHATLSDHQPVLIISDASVQSDGQSGFAWVIVHKATPLWCRMGLAPGPPEDMYSGCAKAFGLLAATIFLQYYLSCFQPLTEATPIACYCDNLGVITMLTNMQTTSITRPNDMTNDNQDIYLAISAVVNLCHMINFQYWHVKDHQEDNNLQCQLTILEQHNVDCNKLAKTFACNHLIWSTTLPNPEFHAAQPHLRIDGKVICHQVLPAL